ncbi:hypothetical protein CDD81_7021 [Ophiocordyceps australis]|uniref:Copper-fist domain-containing protein n=1 Tax=Ophiocordyceps australis TaxID=1399860 RepID=A0A2C5YFR3_9HYPO|nr:hypothetical protein CDD81_7021 [Ophiocordyceps australis]
MLINGEKFACEACVRGHRVSNCQHSDRPLQHINKKGRPVSQCQHCRTLRKSRSAHVKCDCGEKTSKCAHLQQPVQGHKETCCCNHGGRCTCAHKKETSLGTVPESDSDHDAQAAPHPSRPKVSRRRRANTAHSADAIMSFDRNGHHKPTAKHNRSAQKSGPYQLNRVNSTQSVSSLGGSESISYHLDGDAQSSNGRSRASTLHEQRKVKSETASPLLSGSALAQLNGTLPPLDLSRIGYSSYVNNGTFEMFATSGLAENDTPMYSAGLSAASVDWSHYDLADTKGDFAPSSYSQTGAPSFNGFVELSSGSDQPPNLTNTRSTSGNVSEVEDFVANGDDLNGLLRQNTAASVSADLSTIDYDSFYKGSDSSNATVATISMVDEDPAFWMPNYNDAMAAVDESPNALGAPGLGSFWDL